MHGRLLDGIRLRIHNGEITERGCARMLGLSQPHIHNVLKGARSLSPESFDLILKVFNFSILDLCTRNELLAHAAKPAVPFEPSFTLTFLETSIGPGRPWPAGLKRGDTYPAPWTLGSAREHLVLVRLAADPEMRFAGFDIAVIDTSPRARTVMTPDGLYAAERRGEALLRGLRPGAGKLYLVTDTNLDYPLFWEPATPQGLVKGRVLWLGQENARNLPPDQRGVLVSDATSL